jgi:hypothetical protein
MRLVLPLLLSLSLYGCGGECRAPTELLGGTLEGSLDGVAWSASDATWAEAGSAVQINHTMVDDHMLSIVLNSASDTQAVLDLLAAEALPFEVLLGEGDAGGWAVVYTPGGSYSTGNASGGSLTIADRDGDQLLGCLHFEAATNDGESIVFEDGLFRVPLREE